MAPKMRRNLKKKKVKVNTNTSKTIQSPNYDRFYVFFK